MRAYHLGADFIIVLFQNDEVYLYSTPKVTRHHLTEMQKRAIEGKGLSGYISSHRTEVWESYTKNSG